MVLDTAPTAQPVDGTRSDRWRGYRALWWLLTPLIPVWLGLRTARGKEDHLRLVERHGRPSLMRPSGPLLWAHAASVGETNAIFPLLEALLQSCPGWQVLLTTGTRSSAQLLAPRLPPRMLHHYVPLDHPAYAQRFLAHWNPQAVLWSESELWPNLLLQAHARGIPMWLVNGRLSARSLRRWQRVPEAVGQLLACFKTIYAGSDADATRLAAVAAATPVRCVGNLKYDVPALPVDALELARMQENIGERPVILAASTHPNEELELASIHARVLQSFPTALLIIVPRHAQRGPAIAELLERQGVHGVALRSRYDVITSQVRVYVADTMGELGLFYRLAQVAFIGGSLVPHGGQNPLEALRLGVPTLSGLYMQNFSQMCELLEQAGAMKRLLDSDALGEEMIQLLASPQLRQQRVHLAQGVLETHGGALHYLLEMLTQHLQPYPAPVPMPTPLPMASPQPLAEAEAV